MSEKGKQLDGKNREEEDSNAVTDPLTTPLMSGETMDDEEREMRTKNNEQEEQIKINEAKMKEMNNTATKGEEKSEKEETPNEDGSNEESSKKAESRNGGVPVKQRRFGTTTQPLISPAKRKISFADKDQHIQFSALGDSRSPREDIREDAAGELDENDASERLTQSDRSQEGMGEERDKIPFLERQFRFSTVSRFSITSRPSFAGLASRPSMISLKSTLTKVNSELYPERGSFIAQSLGQSFAELPPAIAQKLYIITQVLAAVSVSMGSMAVGFNAAYTSPALNSMDAPNSTLNLTEEQKSWVGSLMPLSALTGSIFGGYLVDALGRKMLILICGPPLFSGMIIIGSAVNVWMLYVGRAIVGLCVGLLTLSLPVYLGETIQPEIRGTLGLFPTTIGNTGILFCFLVGSYVNWSWLAYIGSLIPLVFFSMMIFVPETPRWYVSKGQDDNAERSLQWLRGSDNDVEFELEAIQQNFAMSAGEEKSGIRDLFNKNYLKALGISLGLMAVQQLSGINAVIFYTVDIFELSGSTIDGNLCTIIVGVVNFLSTFVANVLIDKLGRKILLYISDVAMVISLFALGSYFYMKDMADPADKTNEWNETIASISWLPLLSFMIYVIAFSLGWGPIPWLFMGEALPAKVRGPAASLVTAFNWSCTFIITKTFPGMVKEMGAFGVFFMFGVVMVIGFFFSFFFVPETKGKTLEEIEAMLSGRPTHQRRYSEVSGILIK